MSPRLDPAGAANKWLLPALLCYVRFLPLLAFFATCVRFLRSIPGFAFCTPFLRSRSAFVSCVPFLRYPPWAVLLFRLRLALAGWFRFLISFDAVAGCFL